MTEQQIRVAEIINGWVGAVRGDSRHAEILRIYNSYRPLARGYAVQPGDAYCAVTASAAYIKAGIAAHTGTECGVGKWIEIAQSKGIWIENDAYVPRIGDACCYDWEDTGVGDNLGSPDHIGIVTESNGAAFVVTEGNINGGKVGKRTMQVNGRYIRGFIAPDFAAIAAGGAATRDKSKTGDELTALIDKRVARAIENSMGRMITEIGDIPWEGVRAEMRQLLDAGAIDGGTAHNVNPDDIGLPLNIVRALVGAKRYVEKLPK